MNLFAAAAAAAAAPVVKACGCSPSLPTSLCGCLGSVVRARLSSCQHNLASRAAAGKSLPEDLQPMIYCRLEKQWQQSSGRGADNLASEFWVFLVKVTCWSSVLVTVVWVFVVLRYPSRHITPTSAHCHPAHRWLVEKAFLWADLGNALHGSRVDNDHV